MIGSVIKGNVIIGSVIIGREIIVSEIIGSEIIRSVIIWIQFRRVLRCYNLYKGCLEFIKTILFIEIILFKKNLNKRTV